MKNNLTKEAERGLLTATVIITKTLKMLAEEKNIDQAELLAFTDAAIEIYKIESANKGVAVEEELDFLQKALTPKKPVCPDCETLKAKGLEVCKIVKVCPTCGASLLEAEEVEEDEPVLRVK